MVKALAKAKEDLSASLKNKYFGDGGSTYFDAIIEIGIDPVDYLAIYASQEPNAKGNFGKETFMRSIQQSDLPDTQKQYLVALYDIMNGAKEGRQQALENFMGGIY